MRVIKEVPPVVVVDGSMRSRDNEGRKRIYLSCPEKTSRDDTSLTVCIKRGFLFSLRVRCEEELCPGDSTKEK
jgi:hypothetical protein